MSHPSAQETPRRSLNDKAYDYLRQAILSGELPVGTVIAETKVAEDLGISKTPVRQALQLLRTEGLLEVGPRRQLVVRGFTASHRNEILRIREALEEIAVETACREMTLDDVDMLRLLLLRQGARCGCVRRERLPGARRGVPRPDRAEREPADRRAPARADAGLRAGSCGSARRSRRSTSATSSHEHTRIVDAIEQRDEDAARAALHEHLHHWDYLLAPNEECEPPDAAA